MKRFARMMLALALMGVLLFSDLAAVFAPAAGRIADARASGWDESAGAEPGESAEARVSAWTESVNRAKAGESAEARASGWDESAGAEPGESAEARLTGKSKKKKTTPTPRVTATPTPSPTPMAAKTSKPTQTPKPAKTPQSTQAPETGKVTAPAGAVTPTPVPEGPITDPQSLADWLFAHDMTLPENFITKKQAQALGWDSSRNYVSDVAPGMSIGGDYFGNYEGKLPVGKGITYHEADCSYVKGKRNAHRVIYSSDGRVWYTGDHYNTFEELFPTVREP